MIWPGKPALLGSCMSWCNGAHCPPLHGCHSLLSFCWPSFDVMSPNVLPLSPAVKEREQGCRGQGSAVHCQTALWQSQRGAHMLRYLRLSSVVGIQAWVPSDVSNRCTALPKQPLPASIRWPQESTGGHSCSAAGLSVTDAGGLAGKQAAELEWLARLHLSGDS